MECAPTVADKAWDLLAKPVGRQLGYLYNYESNVEELKERAEELKGKMENINHEVGEARGNAQIIEVNVTAWLDKTKSHLEEVGKFQGDEHNPRCLYGIPNLKLRHSLGRKAKKMSLRCDQLLQKVSNIGAICHNPMPEAIGAALYDSGYAQFKSRDAVMEKVMNALRDPSARMIGIYGQGGVGKSTFVKEGARKAKAEKLFSVVAIATITSTPDVRKTQREMADNLGLRLDNESSIIVRAGRLRQRWRGEKNALVILDDLWSGFDLNMLGIQFDDDKISQMTDKDTFTDRQDNVGVDKFGIQFDDEISQMTDKDTVIDSQDKVRVDKFPGDSKSCKILVTSRSKEVIKSEMNIKESSIFSLNVLEKDEALELFQKVAEVAKEDLEFNSLSTEIANRCAELPMAIITVAKALRNNKSKIAWEKSLVQMERQEVVEELKPVELSTKLSYDHMQSEELKSFFLLCARISKNPSITDLVKYCIGIGIFQGVHTVKEARDRTNILVEKLKSSSLLSDVLSDQVTMHDLVRDAALSIAFKEQDIFTMRYGKLDEWPDKEKFQSYTTISLHHCDISDEIPEGLNCPRLKVFHVESNKSSLIIPDHIFEGMGELIVLILTGINLLSLPSSIKSLKKLRMLCLEHCVLGGNISIIGELKKLRVLSLSGSKFENLPCELGQLGKLQLFDISSCIELREIPSNVISNLISLEELYMENDLIQWGVEEETNQKEIACLHELCHLQQLKRLNVDVQNVETLPRSLTYDNLDGYKIVVGHFEPVLFEDYKMCCKFGASRALALQLKKGNDNIDLHMGFIKMLFKSVDHMFLGELDGVQNVVDELNLEGFPCLKHLTIIKNLDIQYIVNSKEVAFPKLESICLYELQKMEKICNVSSLTETSFCNLKTIKINTCSQLKNLFPSFMVRHLTKLEIIEVLGCDSLQEIICAERLDNIVFPLLHTLTLQSLAELSSFYSNEKMLPKSREDEVRVEDEQSSTYVAILFSKNVSVQNLKVLNVKGCDRLEYIFSLSMVESLGNLESLSVERCAMMKHIFKHEYDGTNKSRKGIDLFPQVRKMEVTFMEELETVWYDQASLRSFCSLDYMVVKDCNKLVTIFPKHMVGRFSSLGRLEVMNCKLVENIFDLEDSIRKDGRSETNLWNLHIENLPKLKYLWSTNPKGILDFKNLKNVRVTGCSDLKHVFPISVATCLSKLEDIQVDTCGKMKEIVSSEGMSNQNDIKFDFHQLTTIVFEQLPQLTRFCHERHSIGFPALKKLYLIRCEKLATEKSVLSAAVKQMISKLEAMGIGPKEMEWLQNCIGNDVYQLLNIKKLTLDGLKSVETLFWFLRRIPNLENLFLVRCLNKEMFTGGSLNNAHEKFGTVVHLKSLRLWHVHVVQHIGFLNHPIIQRVEKLYLVDCWGITLFPSSISFTHLTYLEVSRCKKLANLMTSSIAKSLVKLSGIKITQCIMMEEIVITEEEEKVKEIVFSKLKSLELVELRNLKCFCSYNKGLAFKFPSLEKLSVRDCFRMEYFCKNITCTPKLKEVNVAEKEKGYWKGDLNATIKNIFEDMVFFQYTEDLQYFRHRELEKVCMGETSMPNNCFRNIKSLVVKCYISSAHLSKLLSYLKNLEKLEISECFMEVNVFDIDELTKMNVDSFRLKTLTLYGLENLKCVWSKDPDGFVSFPNLEEVVVEQCEKLETLLSASMAKNLVKLEISKCDQLVEIVGKAEAVAFKQSSTLQLPRLTSLLLNDLPGLHCFSPGISILECPKLGVLRVIKCTKLDIFTSEVPSHRGANGHEDQVGTSIHKQPLLLIEKVIPSLETLWLCKKMTSILCPIQYHSGMLSKLKELKLFFGDDENDAETTLPFEFLQKLPNLTSLSIEHFNSLNEMLPSKKTKDIDSKSIMFQKLEDLRVKSCPCLTTLVSSLASFCNLKQLFITECHGLVSLLSSSVAKSLVQLEKMFIEKCESLKQIVSPETGESASDKVIFEKLTAMNLISLSRLVTFYAGNGAVHFPILQIACIIECPMMKKFSPGDIEAPNFMFIQASPDRCDLHYSEGLNSTVEKLFWDRVRHVQDLKLGDHPELEDIWHGVLHIQEMSFSELKSLVVEGCKICSIIPSNLLPHLRNLEALEVRKCVNVKTIFDVNEDSGPSSSSSLQLKKLILEELPNLEHIWNKDPQGIFSLQCLQQLFVYKCARIKSLFPASVAIDKLETLEVKYCEGLEEIIEKDEKEAPSKMFIFHNLSSLTLWELRELKYIYSGLHHLEWPKLSILNVYHCCKLMRTFTTKFPDGHLHEANATDEQGIVLVEKVIPMEELLLSENDIMMFSQEKFDCWSLFKGMRYLKLMCYHGDQTTEFPYRLFLKVRNIEKLLVGCSSFREIFPSMAQLEGPESFSLQNFGFLPYLKELELNDLIELESIGLQHSWHTIPYMIKSLRVVGCSNLIHLVPYTVSFSSLVDLTVTRCHKLEYVFTSSTAKSLTLLKNMSISRCDSMKEIVAEVVEVADDLVKDDIMIRQLETLSLDSLPKLECFYSGSSRSNFASLRNVSINECDSMKYFCQRGDLKTPQLPSDLNDMIQGAHTITPFSVCVQNSWAHRSYVEEASIARDKGPNPHHGALFRKLDSIVFDTRDLLTDLLDSQLYAQVMFVLDFTVFHIGTYLSFHQEFCQSPSEAEPLENSQDVEGQMSSLVDEESTQTESGPDVHKGELFTILDSIAFYTSKLLKILMDSLLSNKQLSNQESKTK